LEKAHQGELAAFLMYARAFPNNVVTLIDSFSTIDSGLLNTISLCAALAEAGINNFGCRLDSGDLKSYAKYFSNNVGNVSRFGRVKSRFPLI
jgi:nicotinic acid phosphoribosyltransferase